MRARARARCASKALRRQTPDTPSLPEGAQRDRVLRELQWPKPHENAAQYTNRRQRLRLHGPSKQPGVEGEELDRKVTGQRVPGNRLLGEPVGNGVAGRGLPVPYAGKGTTTADSMGPHQKQKLMLAFLLTWLS